MDKNSSLMQSENNSYTNNQNGNQVKYAKPHYNLGKALAKKGEWEEAIASYQKAIELAPQWEEVRQYLADAENKLNETKVNGKMENEAGDESTMPHYKLGKMLAKEGEWEEAIASYRKAIEVEPNFADVYHSLGDALVEAGEKEEAIRVYQKAIEIEPNLWEVHHKLGNLLQEVGQFDEAVGAYNKSIELKSDFCWSFNNLGDVLVKLGKWEEASGAYSQAVELNPDFAWGHYKLGDVLVELVELEGAIRCYRRAIELDADLSRANEKLGDALRYQIQRYSEEVSQVYHRAIQENKTDLQVYYKALEVNPKDAQMSLKLADTLNKQGKLDLAITLYKSTLQIEPNNAEIYVKLGDIFLIKGNTGQAIKSYQNALQIQPNLRDIKSKLDALISKYGDAYEQLDAAKAVEEEQLFTSARKHLLEDENNQAIADCSKIISLHPSIANIFPILAQAYTGQGKLEEAEFFLKNSQYTRYLIATQQVVNSWGAIVTGKRDRFQSNSVPTNGDRINKIVIYTCIWGRPELTRIVLSHYAHLKKELSGQIQLELLAVGSEGDASRNLCQECGFDYLEYPNQPLSSKWEYGLNRCADYDPDGVIVMGSDDLISQSLIEFYDEQLKDNLVFCGLKDAYFFDANNQNLILWTGYSGKADFNRVGETIGMGRCLSRTLLDKLEFSIWNGLDINRSLDGAMTQKLLNLGLQLLEYDNCVVALVGDREAKIGHCGFKMAEIGAFAVDIKFSENLTPIERYLERDANALVVQEEPWMILEKYFPSGTVEQLKELPSVLKSKLEVSQSEQISGKSEEQKKTEASSVISVEEEQKMFKEAQMSLRQNEYGKAIEKYSHLLPSYPMLKDIFPMLAEAYMKKEKPWEGNDFWESVQEVRRLIAIPGVEDVWGNVLEELPHSIVNSHNNGHSSQVNKIVIYTCVWKRPELTRVILSYYSMLKRELAGKIVLELLAVGSEGQESRQLCQSCGFDYVEYQNKPLSDKWEYGINRCRDYNPDAVIIVGSDDLISQSLIEFYDRKLKEGLIFCGITDAYFWDLQTENMIHWVGYSSKTDAVRWGETTGMGRCLSGPLLERLDFSIWPNSNKNRGLDGAMTQKLYKVGLELLDEGHSVLTQVGDRCLKVGHCGFKLAELNAMAVDIKFAENLTAFNRYGQRSSVANQERPWEVMAEHFPGSILKELKELKASPSGVKVNTTKNLADRTPFKDLKAPPSSVDVKTTKNFDSKTPYAIEILPFCENSLFLFSGELGKYDVIHAARCGLRNVVLNDINEDFLKNLQAKYLSEWQYIVGDAFLLIDMYARQNKSFDLVNCDPPSNLVSQLLDEYFSKLYKIARKYLVMPIAGDYLEKNKTPAENEALAGVIYQKHQIQVNVINLIQRSQNYNGYYWLVVKKI